MGIGFSGSGPGNTKAIMDWISRRMRGMAMGVREATITVGGIIAAGLLTFLAVTYDWRITMIVMAVITATSATLFFIFYRDKPDSLADSIDRADTTTKPTAKYPRWSGTLTSGWVPPSGSASESSTWSSLPTWSCF